MYCSKESRRKLGAGRKKRVLRHAEAGIHDARQAPRKRIEDGDHVAHLAARHHWIAHAQMRNVEHARLGDDTGAFDADSCPQ